MLTVACDIDGVVADLHRSWLDAYEKDYNHHIESEEITAWAIHKFVKPECGGRIYTYLTAELYKSVLPILGALEGIQELRENHRVVFVTSAPTGTGDAKYHWLCENGFLPKSRDAYGDGRVHPDFITCHDKSLIRADILIDDRAENIQDFLGHGILFDAPYNQDYQTGFRAKTWDDVVSDVSSLSSYETNDTKKHPTELKCPEQAQGFREIIEKMYVTHLNKNADYSPANILGTGELGLATRIWDKCIRYLNLIGFDIRAELVEYRGPKQARNESIEDTLQDMSVYAIIGLLLRSGKWGR